MKIIYFGNVMQMRAVLILWPSANYGRNPFCFVVLYSVGSAFLKALTSYASSMCFIYCDLNIFLQFCVSPFRWGGCCTWPDWEAGLFSRPVQSSVSILVHDWFVMSRSHWQQLNHWWKVAVLRSPLDVLTRLVSNCISRLWNELH